MKRVMIIGGPGSGKSVLAKRLHALTGLPLYHLDQLYWRPGWQAPPQEEWHRTVAQIAACEEWIMDGGYRNTFHLRMPRADTILWLDLPRRVAFPRVLRRMARHFGRVRGGDIAPGCPEQFDWDFLKWAWAFRRTHAAKYRLALAAHASHATVIIFTDAREVDSFLASLNR
jgi:adenylate kinase family enzyme